MNGNIPRMDYRQYRAARRLVHECCNYGELPAVGGRRALRVCTEYQLFAALPLVYRRCPAP